MTDDAPELFDVLLRFDVPFVIIGGHAVNGHGYVRATEDADIIFLRNPRSEAQLYAALSSINAFWISDEIDAATGLERTIPVSLSYLRAQSIMMLGTDLGYLDVFDFIPGLPDASVGSVFDEVHMMLNRPFVSLRWLRRMKEASGRPKDLLDLENLPTADE